jgi:hypothetical protein
MLAAHNRRNVSAPMADEPGTQGGQDHTRVSKYESFEVRYIVDTLSDEFPRKPRLEIMAAVRDSFPAAQAWENREKLMASARVKLQ